MSNFYYNTNGERVYKGDVVDNTYDDFDEMTSASSSRFRGLTSYKAMKELITEQNRTRLTMTTLDDITLVAEKEARAAQSFPQAAARLRAVADLHTMLSLKQMRRW